jgi:hypothetical protein
MPFAGGKYFYDMGHFPFQPNVIPLYPQHETVGEWNPAEEMKLYKPIAIIRSHKTISLKFALIYIPL